VVIGMAIVFVYATLGGMKGITWTQVAQYWVLVTAFLVPAIAISIKLTGHPLPQIGMGSTLTDAGVPLLEKLDQIHADLGFASYTQAFVGRWDRINVFCTTLALMVGTAGLPHVIVRFYTVKTVNAARWSGFYALLFISGLYLTAPATAAFARYYMIESLHERSADELPGWFESWRRTGLVMWLDDGDGRVRYTGGARDAENELFRSGKLGAVEIAELRADHAIWLSTDGREGADGRLFMREQGLSGPDRDIIVLATPEMAGLASWIIALVAAGGLAAALSTASGLLLVISSSVSHDLYYRVLKPEASEAQRLRVGRAVIGLAVVVAGLFGIFPPGFVSQVVAFAFGLAAASFFPALTLGIFTKRVSTIPAVAGMIVGIVFTAAYILGSVYLGMPNWCFGIGPQGIGTIGMLLNFAVTLALTPIFPPPSETVQRLPLVLPRLRPVHTPRTRRHQLRAAPGHETILDALPFDEARIGRARIVEAPGGVEILAELDPGRDVRRPDDDHLGRIVDHLEEVREVDPALGQQRNTLFDHRGEIFDLSAGSDLEELVGEDRPLDASLGDLRRRRTARRHRRDAVEAARSIFRGLVPPVAVEFGTALQIESIEIRRPGIPAVGTAVVEVDHLGPAAARGADHEEGALQPEEAWHLMDRLAGDRVHIVVLALADDVDRLVEEEVAGHRESIGGARTRRPCMTCWVLTTRLYFDGDRGWRHSGAAQGDASDAMRCPARTVTDGW
jgi:cation/acetate symporter